MRIFPLADSAKSRVVTVFSDLQRHHLATQGTSCHRLSKQGPAFIRKHDEI
jgi:hypothetical protein